MEIITNARHVITKKKSLVPEGTP